MERTEMIREVYGAIREDDRLTRSRHGQLEYCVTMHYIHRFLQPGDRVLEIGAGTGRYSIALAREGHPVTAVELVESNLETLRANAGDLANLEAFQADALDLSRFRDDSFDVTLLFGPMYHLYDRADQDRALKEAIRVTRPGGTILTAFLSAHAIICTNYLYRGMSAAHGILTRRTASCIFRSRCSPGLISANLKACFPACRLRTSRPSPRITCWRSRSGGRTSA